MRDFHRKGPPPKEKALGIALELLASAASFLFGQKRMNGWRSENVPVGRATL